MSFTPKNIITKEIGYFEVIKSLRFLFSDNVKNRKDFTVLFTQDIIMYFYEIYQKKTKRKETIAKLNFPVIYKIWGNLKILFS